MAQHISQHRINSPRLRCSRRRCSGGVAAVAAPPPHHGAKLTDYFLCGCTARSAYCTAADRQLHAVTARARVLATQAASAGAMRCDAMRLMVVVCFMSVSVCCVARECMFFQIDAAAPTAFSQAHAASAACCAVRCCATALCYNPHGFMCTGFCVLNITPVCVCVFFAQPRTRCVCYALACAWCTGRSY